MSHRMGGPYRDPAAVEPAPRCVRRSTFAMLFVATTMSAVVNMVLIVMLSRHERATPCRTRVERIDYRTEAVECEHPQHRLTVESESGTVLAHCTCQEPDAGAVTP